MISRWTFVSLSSLSLFLTVEEDIKANFKVLIFWFSSWEFPQEALIEVLVSVLVYIMCLINSELSLASYVVN